MAQETIAVSVDPVTFEVIRHRLLAITDEQAAALAAISGSPLVTEATDFNVGLYLPDGSVAAMGRTILFHASSMASMVRHVIADCGENPGIGPNDMFVVNNPWKGAMHAQDMGILAPLFYQGELIAWSGAMCHMLDVGGMSPGSFCIDATEMYQEGLQLPPTKLMEGGKLRHDVWELILSHSRMAPTMNLDMRGLIAANNAAARGIEALASRYGVEALDAVMGGLIRMSEQRLRSRLRELPDGVVESVAYLDNHGASGAVYEVHLEMTKVDDRLIFDYSQSSPQAPAYINCTWSGLLCGISAAVLPTLSYDSPWNEGLFRPLEVVCPEGRICNASKPAAVSGGALEAQWLVENTALEAISKLVACSDTYLGESQAAPAGGPDVFVLGGQNHQGEHMTNVMLDCLATGGGAYTHRDGTWTQGQHNIERQMISNLEPLELDLPILYLQRGLARDSGGAGRHRGGLSMSSQYSLHKSHGGFALCSCHGWEVPNSTGLFGGYPGTENNRVLIKNSNVHEALKHDRMLGLSELEGEVTPTRGRQGFFPLGPDDVLAMIPQAGGGWGDPLERPIDDLQEDIELQAVSVEAAGSVYGAVLNEQGRLDPLATEGRRNELRAHRRAWTVAGHAGSAPDGPLERVCPLGDRMELARDGQGIQWTRCACGQVFGPAAENWRKFAAIRAAGAEDLSPSARLNEELEIRSYACLACGRLHAVDVRRKDAPDLHDVRLA